MKRGSAVVSALAGARGPRVDPPRDGIVLDPNKLN